MDRTIIASLILLGIIPTAIYSFLNSSMAFLSILCVVIIFFSMYLMLSGDSTGEQHSGH